MMAGNPMLEPHRQALYRRFPAARRIEESLRGRSNPDPFFFFQNCTDPDLKDCWWVLGRLGSDLEKQFSIHGEVLILFTPYEDLQRRTHNAILGSLRAEVSSQQKAKFGSVRFTPDPAVAFVWAPDPNASDKIEHWNLDSTAAGVVVHLPGTASDTTQMRLELRKALHTALASRDLYRGRNPVTGNDFFGRQELLNDLRNKLGQGQSVGLFGLRRSGKTSVIREFQRRNRNAGYAVVLSDLEVLADLDELPRSLSRSLTNELRGLRESDNSIWLGPESDQESGTLMELHTRLVRVAERNRHLRFVVALDEIESLSNAADVNPEKVRQSLGALRGASQATQNLALFFTGVTTRFFSESMITSGVENPLFGFVEEMFLTPFKQEESSNLVGRLGRPMLLEWNDEALFRLHEATGGFPFLVRDLASAVRSVVASRSDGSVIASINLADVSRTVSTWSEGAARHWSEVVRSLELHHHLMADLVRAADDQEIAEWLSLGNEAHVAARCLVSLGLFESVGSTFEQSKSLHALQALGSLATIERDHLQERLDEKRSDANRVRALVLNDEAEDLEFKETAFYNSHTQKKDPALAKAFIRAVASFLNTNGGTLIIGVRDRDRALLGVDRDLVLFGGSRDKLELAIRDSFVAHFTAAVVASSLEISFVTVDGTPLLEIRASRSKAPCWYTENNEDHLFVRNGNQTQTVRGRDLTSFLAARFSAQ